MQGLTTALLFAVFGFTYSAVNINPAKVVCYYNTRARHRQGQGKFEINFLDDALQFCSHLVYGFAAIHPDTYKLVPLDESYDVSRNHYRDITDLKRRFPGLTVLLSVGGGEDIQNEGGDVSEKNIKYRTILEHVDNRLAFVNSAKDLLRTYNFDGLDLAWEFPETKPKVIRGKFKSFFHSIKTSVVGESVADEKTVEHKEQFTALVRELKNAFRHEGLRLTLSVLPNVNSSVYYSPRDLAPHLDLVNLMAFDFYNPVRNPKEADYPAPLYELVDRKVDENVDYQVRYWLGQSFPNNKLLLGIATFGRAWRMDSDSPISGVPPLSVDGPADPTSYTNEPGLLSYAEVCAKLANPHNLPLEEGTHIRKVGDPTRRSDQWIPSDVSNRYGVYAFRLPDDSGKNGIWVGYEDTDTAGNKAAYAKAKGLAGVALVDVTLDDFRGLCAGDKYPILRAAKYRL